MRNPRRCPAHDYREVRPSAASRDTERIAVRCTLRTDHTGPHSHRGRTWR